MSAFTRQRLQLLLTVILLVLVIALILKPIDGIHNRLMPISVFKGNNNESQNVGNETVEVANWRQKLYSVFSTSKDDNNQAKTEATRDQTFWAEMSKAWKNVPKSSAGVPKILHFMYRIHQVINQYKKGIETCTEQNKDWIFVFWSEADVVKFIRDKYPKQFEVYIGFPDRLQRFDAARYLILHYYGGLYVDLDMHCQKPILSVLDKMSCYLDCERPEFSRIAYNREFSAMNSAMGCRPRHPFFQRLIDDLFKPSKIMEKGILNGDTVGSTGPFYLTDTYVKYKSEHPDTDVRVLNASHFTPKYYTDFKGRCKSELAKTPKPNEWRTIACHTLNQIGFDKSRDAYINNSTVAIHQFYHLGYGVQKGPTFDIRTFKPPMIYYENLTAMGL